MRLLTFALIASVLAAPAIAAWYQDRDNSMSDANDAAGDAMAVIYGSLGSATQAIQVCPGVYLTVAHSALANLIDFPWANDRQPYTRVIHYPMVRENMRGVQGDANFISPRLHDASMWEDGHAETDYVFIRVDDPLHPERFVPVLYATPDDLLRYAHYLDQIDIYLYRGKSRYAGAETGALDYSEENALPKSGTNYKKLFQKPQRVNQECEVSRKSTVDNQHLLHSCPTERGVSGSSYVVELGGRFYVVGVNTRGIDANRESFSTIGGSSMLTSAAFCADYERACGTPCLRLEDVLGN